MIDPAWFDHNIRFFFTPVAIISVGYRYTGLWKWASIFPSFLPYNMYPIPSLIFLANCIDSVCPIYQKFTMTTRWKNQRLSCSVDAFWQEETNFFEKNKVYTWIGIQPRCYNHITLELCKMVTYGQLQKMQYIQWSKKDFEKNFSSLVTLGTSNFYRKFIFESINDDDPSIIFSRNNTQQPLRIEKKNLVEKTSIFEQI